MKNKQIRWRFRLSQKVYLIIGIFLFASNVTGLKAQQLPMYSIYNHNGFVLNPAMTGHDDLMAVTATYRHQWSQMPQSPKTGTISFRDYEPDYNMGLGGYIIYDRTGPTSMAGGNFSYAYHLIFDDYNTTKRLAFGLSFSLYQYRLRGKQLILHEQIDNLVFASSKGKIMPDAGLGAFYYTDKFYAGISVPQTIPFNVRINQPDGISNLKRVPHFYGVVGGKLPAVTENSYFEPSAWFKYVPHAPFNASLNARFCYEGFLEAGLAYNTDKTISLEAGVTINEKLHIGYAFGSQFSSLQKDLGTNHEIIITYIIRKNDSW